MCFLFPPRWSGPWWDCAVCCFAVWSTFLYISFLYAFFGVFFFLPSLMILLHQFRDAYRILSNNPGRPALLNVERIVWGTDGPSFDVDFANLKTFQTPLLFLCPICSCHTPDPYRFFGSFSLNLSTSPLYLSLQGSEDAAHVFGVLSILVSIFSSLTFSAQGSCLSMF